MITAHSLGISLNNYAPVRAGVQVAAKAVAAKAAGIASDLRTATVGGAPIAGPTSQFAKPPSAAKL